ncbi:MAG: FAD-dependent oxidoreductase, partial [Candidatus Uhrbacteria bacterium]|nr:FAD-dependent oxidoreductase [Candidatus Uhrbacteria bacterium]
VRFRQARVDRVDHTTKHVVLDDGMTLSYDILVVALGAVPNYFGIDGLEGACIPLKTLDDAYRIRTSIMTSLAKRRAGNPLRVVIAGAGPNGTELAAELAATVQAAALHGVIDQDTFSITLIDAAPNVLMPLPEKLRRRAEKRLTSLGIKLELGKAMSALNASHVMLAPSVAPGAPKQGESEPVPMPYDICVWSGGITVGRIVRELPFAHDPKGRIAVDGCLRIEGTEDAFAVGDCASVRNPFTHTFEPQTAQVAVQQAKTVAQNIVAQLANKPLVTFPFPKRWAILITLGGKYAAGVVGGLTVSGYFAFVLRRLVDLHYFIEVMSPGDAFRFWRRGVNVYAKNEEGE